MYLYEKMIRESSWWDISDIVIPNILGKLLLENPDKMWNIIDKWNKDEHM